jgi:hypothetical protein
VRRLGFILGWLFLVGCVATAPFTTSTVWIVGYGGERRGAVFGLHSGRGAVVVLSRGVPRVGLIAEVEHGEPTAKNYLLPYGKWGWGRLLISVPLYIPMSVVGGVMYWTWRRRRRRREPAGFAVVTDPSRTD